MLPANYKMREKTITVSQHLRKTRDIQSVIRDDKVFNEVSKLF